MNPGLIKFIFLALIFIAVLIETIADILFKKWSLGSNIWLFALALGIYMIGTVFWAISLKYDYLSKAVSVFVVLNMIFVTMAGVIIFKEDLSILNKVGILLGITSVALLQI